MASCFGDIDFIPFRFQGQYQDMETGLYYNRFRYYAPEEGMYVSQDPIGLKSGELKIHSFVNDPNIFVDVLGLECSTSIMNTVGPLTGKKKADIQRILKSQGFTKTDAGNGGEIWTKAGSDGNTASIRLDPAMKRKTPKGFADEVPHAHKEIVPTNQVVNGNYPQSSATKLDDYGNVSTNPRDTHIPIID